MGGGGVVKILDRGCSERRRFLYRCASRSSLLVPAHRYLNVRPSKKSLARARENVRGLVHFRQCFMPMPELIGRVNRFLVGWGNYFEHGYPAMSFRDLNAFVLERLTRHVQRRSQRPFRPPKGVSYYAHFHELGLVRLQQRATSRVCLE